MNKMKRSFLITSILILILKVNAVWAHGGEIEVNSRTPKGPVYLTTEQQKAIALQVAVAGSRPMADLLRLNGEVQLLPNHQADVSTRISGQVVDLYGNLGQLVKRGQPLAKVQSRLVGDPPPSVVITAPMNGVIDTRNVNKGQTVEPNTVLFHLSNRDKVMVVARVFEEDIGRVKLEQKAHVQVLGYPERMFEGVVKLIDPNLDPLTRTVKIWIKIDNPQSLLKPNMFARNNLVLRKNLTALTIPTLAILEANGEKFVFVRKGNSFDRTEVTVGASEDKFSEIKGGLVPGDEVVTQGHRQLYTLWLTGGQMKSEV
jgi:cobalt-zinc-cadmium efflux system membrane fusion protein